VESNATRPVLGLVQLMASAGGMVLAIRLAR